MDPKQISTSELKTHCSRVIEQVRRGRAPVVVTVRGRPVARIVPVEEELPSLFGFARGTLTVHGDLLAPLDEPWEAAQ